MCITPLVLFCNWLRQPFVQCIEILFRNKYISIILQSKLNCIHTNKFLTYTSRNFTHPIYTSWKDCLLWMKVQCSSGATFTCLSSGTDYCNKGSNEYYKFCDNVCKRSLDLCCKSRALCSVCIVFCLYTYLFTYTSI